MRAHGEARSGKTRGTEGAGTLTVRDRREERGEEVQRMKEKSTLLEGGALGMEGECGSERRARSPGRKL